MDESSISDLASENKLSILKIPSDINLSSQNKLIYYIDTILAPSHSKTKTKEISIVIPNTHLRWQRKEKYY